ncbi:hypothetical protein TEA_003717 [Camellia sinensis var. sinensis]|uniref:Serine aminopeptidase S33 domain-containing protein n=1 Tax=Camellia sinensis var. sinensis TaxID=542762 RepID=A0A4S4E9S5_CAMSN|nr:hypothetical protein TEA_003717 [Camellia sinensis var. sinensis]
MCFIYVGDPVVSRLVSRGEPFAKNAGFGLVLDQWWWVGVRAEVAFGGDGENGDEGDLEMIRHEVGGYIICRTYIKHFAFKMANCGWNVVVSNHRGLGGISITSDCFYNAGWTEDIRKVIDHLHCKYPEAPLFVVGTSIGANILTFPTLDYSTCLALLLYSCCSTYSSNKRTNA